MACLHFLICLLLISFCKCEDQLTKARPLHPGDLLVSKSGVFALGFFSLATSNQSLFLGIWYHSIPERTYVWVANRDNPITAGTSPMLTISTSSNFVLFQRPHFLDYDEQYHHGAYAVLLDTGNLVIQLPNSTTIWQSFDHPTDTLLPNMKFLVDYKAQVNMRFVAWMSPNDPSTGNFSLSGDPNSNLQFFLWHGNRPYCRFIMLDNESISGGVYWNSTGAFMYRTIVNTEDEFYIMYTASDGSPYVWHILDYKGAVRRLRWNDSSSSWTDIGQLVSNCELYTACGPFSYCDFTLDTPSCQCLDGFEPDSSNSSRGCRRKQQLRCGYGDHFVTMYKMKVPDKFLQVRNRSFDECAAQCRRNCSCIAYAYANFSIDGTTADHSRCLLWTGVLDDMTRYSGGSNLYLRLSDSRGKWKNNENQKRAVLRIFSNSHELFEKNPEFPYVNFKDVATATNNFSDSNMLGKGGFGKGKLVGGKEVAVKRLGAGSTQGVEHFTNEVALTAKLQHKNLVRLLGCCIHGDEKLLIYEYLSNKSLDYFLFGVARGLVYLHQDSRMKIIHRDLKASNVLLDEVMSPKISDFGMARIFGGNQHQANTKHVVGTYGYMSPEYAMEGIFSVKTDTYSFGVLVLELISGSKISSPHLIMDFPNLIACAWSLWNDGKAEDFVDSIILECGSLNEFLLCIHVGLLCVQDDPDARPLMSSVVAMLENEVTTIPTPKQPAYFVKRNYMADEAREEADKSVNNMSLTTIQGPVMEAAIGIIFHLCIFLFSVVVLSLATAAAGVASDTLSNGRNLTDGNTLVSAGGTFTLGFFSPGSPSRRYLGIWFSESADAVVWVANNRDTPVNNTTGVLAIDGTGVLLLFLDGSGQAAWSSNTTGTPSSAVAQLLETGNLVVRDQSSAAVLWQSFDHPSNTLLAGMRLGRNPQTGAVWPLTSWRSPSDPATGDYRSVLENKGLPETVLRRGNGNGKKYRSGPWNGLWFSGIPEMGSYSSMFTTRVVVKPDEIAYVFDAVTPSAAAPLSRLVMNEFGVVQRLVWDPSSRVWNIFVRSPRDVCDDYAKCGAFGLCNVNTASTLFCSCMVGFSPVFPFKWSMRETSAGCRRNAPLDCGNGSTTDGFVPVRGVKLPDTDYAAVDMGATLDECRAWCLANCSCVAYAAADIRGGGGGSGCVMWIGDIVDVRYVDNGQDLFLRLARSELGRQHESPELHTIIICLIINNKKRSVKKILLPVTAACSILLASIFVVWLCKCRGKLQNKVAHKKRLLGFSSASNELGDDNLELPFVNFGDIAAATNNFSDDNMLGQGGFGKVYKGMLDDNKEVAIKRLSKGSGQGVEEFRNEVVLIAKLQHRNLVKLLGCCIHGDEKLLMFKIIKGVARGLLYLQQDSRLTIVHRDLKSSNILLDVDMSPKISDFGMARIFGGNQQEANTNRVVGTYGYMSPEYAMDGIFSAKSDIYSYGVILLEIVSGLKISLPRMPDFSNLLAYAWSLWKDNKAMNLVDSSIVETCSPTEVLLCIHIGLLCVQDNPNKRPLMSSVVSMLENETTALSAPIQPVYFAHRASEAKQTTGENTGSSTNGMSLTDCYSLNELLLRIHVGLLCHVFRKTKMLDHSCHQLWPCSRMGPQQFLILSNLHTLCKGILYMAEGVIYVNKSVYSMSPTTVQGHSRGRTIWTTNNDIVDKAYAVLLDSGNLVLQQPNNTTIWQSFDHPTDTLLPNMKFRMNYKAQVVERLVAWKGLDDPSTGDFSCSGDPSSNFQAFIWHGTTPYYRAIVLDSVKVSGAAYGSNTTYFMYQNIINTGESFYVTFTTSEDSPYAHVTLDYMGNLRFLSWNDGSSSWTMFNHHPVYCELYNSCGPFSYCDLTLAVPGCQCLDGFEPDTAISSRGCRRIQELICGDGNHFVTMPGMKVPDKFLHIQNKSFDECMAECSHNCSCTAYAYISMTITGTSGTTADKSRCLLWIGELVDTARASTGDNLYLRLANSPGHTSGANTKKRYLIKVVVPIIACLLILTCIYLVWKWQSKGKRRNNKNQYTAMLGKYFRASHELYKQNQEFPCINFEDIATATNNFSDSNMLGQGGFGKVYKGMLEGGKEVAVKRLSKGSTQGVEHFTNEVVLIAKLQHKNLVRLLGCCIHGDEKLLIYEYLPNKSLDYFLLDTTRKNILNWQTRFKIIKGVARGLLYLHQDSRLTIVHRDLKSSNILLDAEMSPKISDFGMARIFGGSQQEANTNRVVGTYGYMSPEYAMDGTFSVKSDTYSFGVVLLEIVSGFKISLPPLTDFPNLLAYAWNLWKDDKAMSLVDSSIVESCSPTEVLLCIHIGLLCVQDNPNNRPLMSSVVFMLENKTTELSTPIQPMYFAHRASRAKQTGENTSSSINDISLTSSCLARSGKNKAR
uniref:non-specific serine/threonine protein kinase n=1 Tax=Leersia perrieri TaxID=77586 RepID=A0A0D9WA00_9ORYZ